MMTVMGRSPLIAVAIGRERVGGRVFAAAPYDYVTSVVAAGGIPFLVPPLTAASAGLVLAPAAGLLLTGGGDVAPFRYGEETDPARGEVDEERDESELALVRQAGAMGIPILAVCRGAQLLNVALGGTLKQHICDERARSPPMARTPIRGGASRRRRSRHRSRLRRRGATPDGELDPPPGGRASCARAPCQRLRRRRGDRSTRRLQWPCARRAVAPRVPAR